MAALAVTVASVLKSSAGNTAIGTAGATITQGQPVYVDTTVTPNTIKPANGSSAGSAVISTVAGIAQNAALTGQPISYVTTDTAFAHGFSTSDVAAGQIVYLDDTAGNMTVTFSDLDATDWVTAIGIINATESTMNLLPLAPVVKA